MYSNLKGTEIPQNEPGEEALPKNVRFGLNLGTETSRLWLPGWDRLS